MRFAATLIVLGLAGSASAEDYVRRIMNDPFYQPRPRITVIYPQPYGYQPYIYYPQSGYVQPYSPYPMIQPYRIPLQNFGSPQHRR